jgi:hypothetical protein
VLHTVLLLQLLVIALQAARQHTHWQLLDELLLLLLTCVAPVLAILAAAWSLLCAERVTALQVQVQQRGPEHLQQRLLTLGRRVAKNVRTANQLEARVRKHQFLTARTRVWHAALMVKQEDSNLRHQLTLHVVCALAHEGTLQPDPPVEAQAAEPAAAWQSYCQKRGCRCWCAERAPPGIDAAVCCAR